MKNSHAYDRLALVDFQERRLTDAARWLQRAFQLGPYNTEASAKLATHCFTSSLQNHAKRKKESEEARNTDNTPTMNPRSYIQDTLAYVYTRKGLSKEGLRALYVLVDEKPNHHSFRRQLALYQKSDRSSAPEELDNAFQEQPSGDEQRKIKELMAKVS